MTSPGPRSQHAALLPNLLKGIYMTDALHGGKQPRQTVSRYYCQPPSFPLGYRKLPNANTPNTHCLCSAGKSHSARLLLPPPPTSFCTHTPFGCNKTTDQSHWLLTGTDTESCCCWKAAWEMFITHKACRFGQQKNSGLIKWRPGAAGGEIHTRPHRRPHVL